jgi:hypothetical protein
MSKPITHPPKQFLCDTCRREFWAWSRNALRCPACRPAHDAEQRRLYQERERARRLGVGR